MSRSLLTAVALAALASTLALGRTVGAQTLENGLGMGRHFTNVAGFTQTCIEKQLLDKSYEKYGRFGSYLGGFVLGALYREPDAANKVIAPYLAEGANGRVHEFDEKGTFMAYDIEFTKENCAALSGFLKNSFEQFSQLVLKPS